MELKDDLAVFFEPKSVAIVGISRRKPSLGQLILENLIVSDYNNPIYLINPKAEEISGRKCLATIGDIPSVLDLAIILTPARFVLQAIKDSIVKGARGIIIITAGFSEVSEEGKRVEQQFLQEIKGKNVRIVGPNSMGTFSDYAHASFSPIPIEIGKVAYLSQSGSILVVAAEHMLPFKLGMSKFISLGNKIDVNFNTALRYLHHDNKTEIINAYLESFSEPRNLRKELTEISKSKPIVMVKGGRTTAGAKAATSHTGALAGEHRLVQAVLESAGVITASNIADQVSITRFLRQYSSVKDGGIALISSAGGPSILAADEVIEMGLKLANFSDHTHERLSAIVPPQGSHANPIDILAAADEKLHTDVIEVLLDDPDVAAIIIIIVHPVLIAVQSLFDYLQPYLDQEKPIICAYLGPDYLSLQKQTKVMVTGSTKEAITMVKGTQFYSRWRENLSQLTNFSHLSSVPQESPDLKLLLQQFNFLFPPECISANFDQILDFIKQENYPVVMKIEHPKFSHKSDVGGVFLNLRNQTDLDHAWKKIHEIYSNTEIPAKERQVSIQPYYEDGIEIALGIIHDNMFGHFVMAGSGGTMIELFEDVAFAPSPISRYSANKLLHKLKLMKILTGFRQFKPVNITQIIEKILDLDNLVYNNPQIKELDINPLMVLPDGRMVVIDARVEYTY